MMRLRSAFRALLVCAALAAPVAADAQLRLEVVMDGLQQPVAIVPDPLFTDTFFILEKVGRIQAMVNGVLQPTLALDVQDEVETDNEQGLLSLAINPANPQQVFVFLVRKRTPQDPENPVGDTVIARFTRSSGDPRVFDPASRLDLMWPDGRRFLEQPTAVHKGGGMHFGPDGYLYIGLGDGGLGGDPFMNAQSPEVPFGKFLRIDVNVPESNPYGATVPPDNPFLDGQPVQALPFTWSVGWRNPWRWSFDDFGPGATGAMIIADVGEQSREEINYEPAGRGGRNYGWYMREGTIATPGVNPGRQPSYLPLQNPMADYGRDIGRSVTGGYVYRGSALPAFYRGRYFVADFFRGVYSLGLSIDGNGEARVADVITHTLELGDPRLISSFGRGHDGELYILVFGGGSGTFPFNGRIWRLVGDTSNPPGAPQDLAAQVSGSTVTLGWQPASTGGPALSYQLEAGSVAGASDLLVTTVPGAGIVVPNVARGRYWVRVRAENAGGMSDPSADVPVRVACGGLPLVPANLQGTVDAGVVSLQWDGTPEATSYVIEAGSGPGLANLAQLPSASPSFTGAPPAGTYYVRIRAVTACETSPASNEIVVTVP